MKYRLVFQKKKKDKEEEENNPTSQSWQTESRKRPKTARSRILMWIISILDFEKILLFP